ncbi:MAG: exodeoxyribonuclease VII small subunit [Firmicutes bacterium]|nr:exodeoxyribonuclease VII small subunit [Bacillota bacterium]
MGAQKTFEENLADLEKIIGQLEKGDVPLSESLTLFEEGVQLIRLCSKQLDAAEARIAQLVTDEQSGARMAPFDLEGESKGV